MAYYFNKTLPVGFEEAVRRTMEALKQQGFGIITEIDVRDDRRHDRQRNQADQRLFNLPNQPLVRSMSICTSSSACT